MSDEEPTTRPAPGNVPNEAEAEAVFGVDDDSRSLAEQGLLDEDGIDRRLYSGEPVPTEHGSVTPAQSPSGGSQQDVGGGEWPEAPPRGTDGPPPPETDDGPPVSNTGLDDDPSAPSG